MARPKEIQKPRAKPTWIEAGEKKPTQWDLVVIRDDKGIEQPAWWTGITWDWGKKHVKGNIICWHRLC